MPTRGAVDVEMVLEHQTTVAAEQGGRLVAVDLAPGLARWRLKIRTAALDMERLGEWRAFLDSLRGASRTFIGFDPARKFPVNYRNGFAGLTRAGGGSFDGTASSWSINTDRDEPTLNGLPASFKLRPGDMLGFSWSSGAKRTLHRILESVDANGSGVATVQVEPRVPAYVSTATATLATPGAVMRLVPGSVSAASTMHVHGSVSFEAVQHLEA